MHARVSLLMRLLFLNSLNGILDMLGGTEIFPGRNIAFAQNALSNVTVLENLSMFQTYVFRASTTLTTLGPQW